MVEPTDRADAVARLADVGRALGESTACRVVETGGPVAAALLAELDHSEKELWCIGSHARSGRARLLHGSTAFELAHRAAVPVLIQHQI